MINDLLNESSGQWRNMQAEANRLADKWSASGLLEGLSKEQDKQNMSMILENQAKELVKESSLSGGNSTSGGSFTPGAGEQWAGVALPLVRKVFAQIAAKDFVSVQPMSLPSGLVFYLDFKYGSAFEGRTVGENMYGNVSTANDKIGVDVPAAGGLYGAGQFGYSINETSSRTAVAAGDINAATVTDVNYDDDVVLTDLRTIAVATSSMDNFDAEGVRAFRLLTGAVGAEVDATYDAAYTRLAGGNVVFVDIVANPIVAADVLTTLFQKQPVDNDRGDFEDRDSANPISIPEVNVELASEAIVAKTRKLKAQWTPEFAQDLNAYHSIDAEAELTSILSEYISMEIDLEILDMLIQDARTTERWSAENNRIWNGTAWAPATSDFYNTQGQWFQTLGTKIQKVSNKIHQKTLRGGANFLVCSPEIATVLESIPGYAAATDGDKMEFAFGVQKVGSLNSRFKVYKNPYMTENTILMGYRGGQFLESGAVYAPYIPLMMTPLVYDPNTFTPRKGIMTRYAKKMIRPEFYGRIFVSDLASI